MDKDYRKYLASKEWKDKANRRMEMDRFLCQDCGSAYNLVVHHCLLKSASFICMNQFLIF